MSRVQSSDSTNNLQAALGVHRDTILRFVVARTGSRDDAEDLVQDLWEKCARTRTGPIANVKAYLFTAANNLVRDHAVQRRRAVLRDDRWWQETTAAENALPIAAPQHDNAELLNEIARLRAAIVALPDGARRILVMHKIEERAHSEIAAILGISRSAVEKHMAVAMRHLRNALIDCGDDTAVASNPIDGTKL